MAAFHVENKFILLCPWLCIVSCSQAQYVNIDQIVQLIRLLQ